MSLFPQHNGREYKYLQQFLVADPERSYCLQRVKNYLMCKNINSGSKYLAARITSNINSAMMGVNAAYIVELIHRIKPIQITQIATAILLNDFQSSYMRTPTRISTQFINASEDITNRMLRCLNKNQYMFTSYESFKNDPVTIAILNHKYISNDFVYTVQMLAKTIDASKYPTVNSGFMLKNIMELHTPEFAINLLFYHRLMSITTIKHVVTYLTPQIIFKRIVHVKYIICGMIDRKFRTPLHNYIIIRAFILCGFNPMESLYDNYDDHRTLATYIYKYHPMCKLRYLIDKFTKLRQ